MMKSFALVAERLTEVTDWLLSMRLDSVPERLAEVLKRLDAVSSNHVVPLTQEQLALIVGASREAVARALVELRERGLVETHRGRSGIVVLDPDNLA